MKIGRSPLDATYATLIKPIRNQMRKFDYLSLFDAILVYLNPPIPIDSEKLRYLNRLPWVAEKLALWLLADVSHMHSYGRFAATENDVRKLIALAWESGDFNLAMTKSISNLSLFARQLMLTQAPYQNGLSQYAFAIQLHMLKKLKPNSNLRKFLDNKARMPIDEYFEIAFLFWIKTATDTPWVNKNYVHALAEVFSVEKQTLFFKSLTTTLKELQSQCSTRTIAADEWFQPTYFYRTPCIWHKDACVPFGRETYRRFFEALIGDWIEESGSSKLRQDYDRLIEDYVADSLNREHIDHYRENHLLTLVPKGNKIVDFMIEDDDTVVLIEVKNKGLSRAIPADQDPLTLRSRLSGTIIKAQTQLAAFEQGLRSNIAYVNIKIYKIIVTTNRLWINNAELLSTTDFNATRTWLVSLHELDMLIEIVVKTGRSISHWLAQYESNQSNHDSSLYTFEAFLEKIEHKPERIPEHLFNELDLTVNKIKSLFPDNDLNSRG